MESLAKDDKYGSMKSASSTTAAYVTDAPDLSHLLTPVKEELVLVEQLLTTNLIDSTPFVAELLSQIFQAGGKRIRPAVIILAGKASAKEAHAIGRLHIVLAVLTELIHTASLVHDDVIDRASLRRGKPSINRRFNDRLAVLLGDLLFAQASICLARIMNPVIVGIYGQVLGDLCAGEICQMQRQYSTSVDWDGYIRKSVCKTASLFSAGTHSAAILNAAPDTVIIGLKEYGLNLGICFQIIDDLLDIIGSSSELGKEPGSDLQSGVLTAPAMFVLEQQDKAASKLAKLIKTRAVSEPDGRDEALYLIRTHGGVEGALKLALSYAEAAREALSVVPRCTYRHSLENIVEYMLKRTH